MYKTHLPWLLLALAVGAVALLYPLSDTPPRAPAEREHGTPLRIALNPWPGYAHALLARDLGLFAKHGVEVRLVLNQAIAQSVEQFERGEVDALFDVFTDLLVTARHHPARVVYVCDYSHSGDVIVAANDIEGLSGLAGRTVGVTSRHSFSHLYMLKALEGVGLQAEDVTIEEVAEGEVVEALADGRISAGHTWEPHLAEAVGRGFRVISKAGEIPGIITDVLAFRAEVVERRADDVQRVVDALFEAQRYAERTPEEATRRMAAASGMSREEMVRGLSGIIPLDRAANRAALGQGREEGGGEKGMLDLSGRFLGRNLLRLGVIDTLPDLEKLLDPRFVQSAAARP